MKKIFLLSFAFLLIAGNSHAQTPPHAASTQTWTFGNQVWSDAIRIPDCNKTNFTASDDLPDCRSYTEGTKTWYYYNWAYVNAYKYTLCPKPWHVPSRQEFDVLTTIAGSGDLIRFWGLTGEAYGGDVYYVEDAAKYWSSTPNGSADAYNLYYHYGYHDVSYVTKENGFPVRCVR
jgi:hypothetical protein